LLAFIFMPFVFCTLTLLFFFSFAFSAVQFLKSYGGSLANRELLLRRADISAAIVLNSERLAVYTLTFCRVRLMCADTYTVKRAIVLCTAMVLTFIYRTFNTVVSVHIHSNTSFYIKLHLIFPPDVISSGIAVGAVIIVLLLVMKIYIFNISTYNVFLHILLLG